MNNDQYNNNIVKLNIDNIINKESNIELFRT